MASKTHRAALITAAGSPFKIGQVPTKEPGFGEVRIKVTACGICATDHLSVDGYWPGIQFPHVGGHEVIGRIDAIGQGVAPVYKIGQRVGVGYPGGYCGVCEGCLSGDLEVCDAQTPTGLGRDGGWQEYLNVPTKVLVRIPDDESQQDSEVAPLLCAGVTMYGALREASYRPGDLCIVQGMGGLGHLGIQYAAKLGLRVIAVSNTTDKRDLVRQLGAEDIWSADEAVAKSQSLGGAKLLLATSPNTSSINAILPALSKKGQAVIVGLGADDEIKINTVFLVANKITIQGSVTTQPSVNEENIRFALQKNVKAIVNTFPLESIQQAYDEVIKGRPKFRNVVVF
ncbi:alcohol dehydrogenase GroES domain-containing protein [Atractiella rhizophila]|nr:alcohol dehydrogenase GroES domain-containing protein [Atractiella rhizophila]